MDAPIKKCLFCEKPLIGRRDKKYCDSHCRNAYHYQLHLDGLSNLYQRIDYQLKKNRKILKFYNQAGKSMIRSEVLLAKGFNPNLFTHYWKSKSGKVYLFVYEFGFLKTIDRDKEKYLLIHWQPYMSQSLFN